MRRREFVKAGLLTPALAGCASPVVEPGPVIDIRPGQVQGSVVDGVHRFLGIPYAEPPFGKHRFMPPVPRSAWQGILPADRYGEICPQTGGESLDPLVEGEDCLNLNVWTPDPSARGLPVMVWVHGGGQVTGTGSAEISDGSHFAREGVVLVTNNRRLGAEGYLFLEPYFGDGIGPGNLGILDQIEVLRWVQENITQFGGDPGNVTVFGISGGGAATQALVATAGSGGLVHRVIPQSGGHAAQRAESAAEISRRVLEQLAIRPGDLDTLQRVPWPELPKLYPALQATDLGRPQIYLPLIGETMPIHPVDAPYEGIGADLDYLIGSCLDEGRLFSLFGEAAFAIFERRGGTVLQAGGAQAGPLVDAYRRARPELDEDAARETLAADMWFRAPAIRIADGHAQHGSGQTHMYLFTWESQFLGATHGMDIAVFGNGVPFAALAGFRSNERVGGQMRAAWIQFAKTGNPTTPSFAWPGYELASRNTVAIDDAFSMLTDPYRLQRAALGEVLTMNWQDAGL